MASAGKQLIQKFFVSNIPWTVGHRDLRTYFKEFGRVLSANVVFDKKTGCSKGYGFVVFKNKDAVANIENKKDHKLDGSYLTINHQSK